VEIGGLRVGVTQIRIRRLGYRTQYLALDARSRLDTAVVWLEPVAANLPAIESRRSAIPGTYYRQLDVNGFYERMLSGARSRSAFVTDSAIERWKPQVISDLGRRIGRDLVRCSFLVDGVPVQPPLPEGRRRTVRSGIDALIQPTEVAGIEVYRTVEVPTQFAFATAGRPCLVVVWQK
jgi:hypothetical protein